MLYLVFGLEMFYLLVTNRDKRQYNKRQKIKEIYYVWSWYLAPQTITVPKIIYNKAVLQKYLNSWWCMVSVIYSLLYQSIRERERERERESKKKERMRDKDVMLRFIKIKVMTMIHHTAMSVVFNVNTMNLQTTHLN